MTTDLSPYAKSFPLAQPDDAHWTDTVVTQGHVEYCAAHGHATNVVSGVLQPLCPRCGEAIPADRIPQSMTAGGATAKAPAGTECDVCGPTDQTVYHGVTKLRMMGMPTMVGWTLCHHHVIYG